jgi:hypothetical protein
LVLVVLGTLSKPTAVVTPAVVAALDLFVVGRGWRRVGRDVWPWVVAVVPCVVWAKVVQHVPALGPWWSRPLVALDAVAFYLGKVVWPGALGVDYGRNPLEAMARGWLWWTWVVPVGVAAVLWWKRVEWRVLVGAGVVFVAGMAPVSGVVPFMFQRYSTVADHYMYLPMVGVGVAVAWGVSRWPTRGVGVVVGAWATVLVVWSVVQAGVWADDETLARHGLAVNPGSFPMLVNLATTLDVRAEREGDVAGRREAERLFGAALKVRPMSVLARQGLAVVMLGRGEEEGAVRLLKEGVRIGESTPVGQREEMGKTYHTLGLVYERQGRMAEAREMLGKAAAAEPGNRDVQAALRRVGGGA